jgi:protein-disulfide isomerase
LSRPDDARFYFVPYVLGPHSVGQTSALYMAAQEGKFFDMLDELFDRRAMLSPRAAAMAQAAILLGRARRAGETDIVPLEQAFVRAQAAYYAALKEAVAAVGLDGGVLLHRIENKVYLDLMLQKNELISRAGIHSVPTVMINGQVVDMRSRTPDCLTRLITGAAHAQPPPARSPQNGTVP